MKIVIAIDSFKGSLSSREAAFAIRDAAYEVFERPEVLTVPIADGGEGTARALVEGLSGKMRRLTVTGPLGESVSSEYGMIGSVAVIEMSEAAGITLVPPEKRDPMKTTTYGVGELIVHAMESGCRDFIIGIGGSATNDGGAGMLEALGFELLNKDGGKIERGCRGLSELVEIKTDRKHPLLSECNFRVASDVTNPLLGERGCSRIFGPQKGADEASVVLMDEYLTSYAKAVRKILPYADENAPGAGAAGGLGFALLAFLSAKLERGIELVLKAARLKEKLVGADLLITGEGRLDSQTVMGKAPVGVAEVAKEMGIPVIAFAGAVSEDAKICNSHGIDAFFPITRRICSLDEAMDKENAYKNMKDTAKQVFLLMRAIKGSL